MTLKVFQSKGKSSLIGSGNRSLYFSDLANTMMIKLPVKNWKIEWKQVNLQGENP